MSKYIPERFLFILCCMVCCIYGVISVEAGPLPIPTRPTSFPLSRPSLTASPTGVKVAASGQNSKGRFIVPSGLIGMVEEGCIFS